MSQLARNLLDCITRTNAIATTRCGHGGRGRPNQLRGCFEGRTNALSEPLQASNEFQGPHVGEVAVSGGRLPVSPKTAPRMANTRCSDVDRKFQGRGRPRPIFLRNWFTGEPPADGVYVFDGASVLVPFAKRIALLSRYAY